MSARRMVSLEEIDFPNARFWAYFLSTSYPNALLEETDQPMYDLVGQVLPVDVRWTDAFTQYYDGVIEERDGYLDAPTTLEAPLDGGDTLKIEFHPGDTLFFLGDTELGSTGPHHRTGTLPYPRLKPLLSLPKGPLLFQLLLPMARVTLEEAAELRPLLRAHFTAMGIPPPSHPALTECLISGLAAD